jgi:hypothetical protein
MARYLCRWCRETDESKFYPLKRRMCKACRSKKNWAEYGKKNRGVEVENGIQVYSEIVAKLGADVCEACGKTPMDLGKPRLELDIDPQTRSIRGLLCRGCLWLARNARAETLGPVADYLKKKEEKGASK